MSRRSVVSLAALSAASSALAACGREDAEAGAEPTAPGGSSSAGPTDAFPVTVAHQFGETVVPAAPQRVVVVGLTEQDVLLELGVVPVATTEWYGERPHAVWPWATDLLGGAAPEVLSQADGLQLERIAALAPDLIVGTNAGLTREQYETLSALAPTVTSVPGAERYSSSWVDQTRQIARAVGRSAAGEALISGVQDAYARAAAEHPEFAGKQATFSQGSPYSGVLYVYPDGFSTDFLTDLGFRMTPGLESWAAEPGQQAQISAERTDLLEADVVVFATEEDGAVDRLLDFGTLRSLPAVEQGRAVYTDPVLSGAIYFNTPLSRRYLLEHLTPQLVEAVAGRAPQDMVTPTS
jgi:iron complex transport system substrate-binding protein